MEVMAASAVAWSHAVLDRFLEETDIAVDLTAGNGKDTLFLAYRARYVVAMDIQEAAIEKTKGLMDERKVHNVRLIHDSHEALESYVTVREVDAFVMNLGYLPGGDKTITTTWASTERTLRTILASMKSGAIISLSIYPGHEAGKVESRGIDDMIRTLDQKLYRVSKILFPNQQHCPPYWVGIQRC
ncbi:MAG: class I SAM-dependent methyltransferase [Peptoniphilus sp.]|nr:class I SAM-dependent methyltransferase [Peptoniphilus sp.]MDY3119254.1 class I SAM-dependent methyltransferase [Peptoniphilus sp.]